MASLEQIAEALRRADAAGNVEDARALAQAYRAAQQQPVPAPQPQQPAPGFMDFVSQGMSGVNEGIANVLGAPVDITAALMNAGSSGINALTGSQIPQITNPAGGQNFFRGIMAPTIGEESDNPYLQGTRRIGQEIGSTLIPGMGPVAKSAKPLSVAAKELAAALGGGTGAAIAQQTAPGNPLVEFGAQIAGSLAPGGLARVASRPPKAPSIDELRTARNTAYKAAENTGAVYSPQVYDDMLAKLAQDVTSAHISPTRHAAAFDFIRDMIGRRGKPMSLTELDQLRQEVRRDLITPSYGNQDKAADAFFGDKILDHIDEMIETNSDASAAMKTARQAHATLRKSELIEEALTKAARRTASTGSGGNINNAIRQNIRAILDNPKKAKAFTAEERLQMESLVRQGKMEDLLRLIGKLSPSGNGLMAALGIGGTAMNPFLAAAPLAGMGAKALADRSTLTKALKLQDTIAQGGKTAPKGLSADQRRMIAAVLSGQVANQAGPVEITVNGGRN